jgi:hypothetical protein
MDTEAHYIDAEPPPAIPSPHPSWVPSSPSIALVSAALAAAQGEMENASKDRQNTHFNSRYADLASVIQAVRAPLSKHGIAFTQPTTVEGGRVIVRTLLSHKSGEWVGCELSARPQQDTPQGIGSTMTYLRRYSLMAMTGIAPDDDDGEAGMGREVKAAPPPPKPAPKKEAAPAGPVAEHDASWTATSRAAFCAAVDDIGFKYDQVAEWCVSLGRPRPSGMDAPARKKLLDHLRTDAGKFALGRFLVPPSAK